MIKRRYKILGKRLSTELELNFPQHFLTYFNENLELMSMKVAN